jgi:hypothetical protein
MFSFNDDKSFFLKVSISLIVLSISFVRFKTVLFHSLMIALCGVFVDISVFDFLLEFIG